MKKISLLGLFSILCALPLFFANDVKATETFFNYDRVVEENLVGGVTKQDIITAYEAEAVRLKAVDFSFGTIEHPLENGWEAAWTIAVHLRGSSSSANIWGQNYALIIYNANLKQAFTLKDDFAMVYTGANDGTWGQPQLRRGWPTSNEFTAGDTTYQNFSYGHIKKTATGITWIANQTVDAAGVASDITFDQYVEQMPTNIYYAPKGATIEKYKSSFKNALEGRTYNFPFVENLRLDWPGEYTMVQFVDGESFSTANLWGAENKGYLVYNKALNKFVTMIDEFAAEWSTTYSVYGAPMDKQFAIEGVKYQNFAAGYLKLEGVDIVFEPSKQMGTDGIESILFTTEDVGQIDENVSLPDGMSQTAVKEAFKSVFKVEMGIPSTFVDFYPSSAVLMQKLINAAGGVTYIYLYDLENVVVLTPEVYAKYHILEGYTYTGEELLGLPVSSSFTIDGKIYQNFSKGYIEISNSVSKPVVGAKMGADGTRTILDFSDNIFVNGNIRIPKSYNITKEQLLTKFKEKYASLIASGFAAGFCSDEGIKVWTEYEVNADNEFDDNRGMIVLAMMAGDSTAKPFYNVTMYLVYSPETGEVISIKDQVMTGIASFRSQLGAPRGESFKVGNITIQNFQMGYVTATQMGSVSYKDSLNYNQETGKEVNLDGTPVKDTPNPDVPEPPKDNKSNVLPIILGIVGGVILVSGGVVVFIFWKKKRG